jgi:ABC-type nitrate/sulfonate/bicarbonate transport system permease component
MITALIAFTLLIVIYQGVLLWTPYSAVLPSLSLLVLDYIDLLFDPAWMGALLNSIGHSILMLLGLSLFSLVLVMIGIKIKWVSIGVKQISEWMASTPTIAILLLGLILFGLTQSVNIIVGFIVWPLVYERLHHALTSLTDDEQDVMRVFTPTWFEEWIKVRLARVKDELGSMTNIVFPTTLKILIMVEVLHSQSGGYGFLYQLARQSFQIERLITLTIHLIVILKILKTLTSYYFHKST